MPVKNIIPGQHVTSEKLQRSRELHREMTPAEKILWEELRANKLGVQCDLTPVPFPNGEGMELTSFLPDGVLGFQNKAWNYDGFSSSPLGEAGEGFGVGPHPD